MKNKILGLLLLIPFIGFGQLQSGDILIESNYGFVGGKGLWGTIADEAGIPVEFFGPATVRFQYMTSDKFGVGCDINYSSRSIGGNTGTYTDLNGMPQDFTYDLTQNVIRLMIRTSWEFVNNDKFQMNWANSVGYRMAPWTFTVTDNSNATEDNLSYDFGTWPLAFRTAIGMRYFVSDNIGLNMEVIGLSGGSLMNAGVSFKF
jgi:hypothetical protein